MARLNFLLCLLCLFAATGCSVTRGKRLPDGTITVSNYRLLWKSEAISFGLSTFDPRLSTQLVIGKSASDEASVGAVAEGVATGVTKGVIGKP